MKHCSTSTPTGHDGPCTCFCGATLNDSTGQWETPERQLTETLAFVVSWSAVGTPDPRKYVVVQELDAAKSLFTPTDNWWYQPDNTNPLRWNLDRGIFCDDQNAPVHSVTINPAITFGFVPEDISVL